MTRDVIIETSVEELRITALKWIISPPPIDSVIL